MIICISGLAGSGKDTVAEILHEYIPNSAIISISESLKRMVSNICNVDYAMLEGKTNESREWREIPNPEMSYVLGKHIMTPRKILCNFSDIQKMIFGYDIFIRSLANKYLLNNKNNTVYIITDLRFYTEYEYLKTHYDNILTINVMRTIPSWYNIALKFNIENTNENKLPKALLNVHKSERDLIGRIIYDYIIYNDSTIDNLKTKIKKLFKYI